MKNGDKATAFCSVALLLALAFLSPHITHAGATSLDRQRQLFVEVYPAVERGDWSAVDALSARDRRLLQAYVLWPDLRSTWLKATIRNADHSEIEAFLDRYGTLKPARELRYRYAMHLARTGNLAAYLDIYQSFYQGIALARLDCLALQAELETGREAHVVTRAIDLWLVGRSQVDECDPVFDWIRNNDKLGILEYRKRFELAIEEREFTLARWLGRAIDEQHEYEASRWLQAQRDPERFVRRHNRTDISDADRAQLVYAVERVTYRDPGLAAELWKGLSGKYAFSREQKHRTARHIALWKARDNLPDAYTALVRLPPAAQNDEVARWRARTSLRNNNWKNLLDDIEVLSDSERQSEEWRYWRAHALDRTGRQQDAQLEFGKLAEERSYYGFLAADEIDVPYLLDHAETAADEAIIAAIASKPPIVRARELFIVGLDGRGRSEWDNVVAFMNPEEQTQAAILADRWGWHSRAISTAARVGEYDDLELRYPLAFLDDFERLSEQARIPPTWAYGIARSESLFMRDVRSHAGAIGLMQLMPATGKQVAREIRLPYSGLATLTDPVSNIRLGTTYLAKMAERYDGNRVLATAAYNAGPHRVDEWLPVEGALDARVWIENIPFDETRKYVRRVLAAETIFHWRMTGDIQRLSDHLMPVVSVDEPQQLASR